MIATNGAGTPVTVVPAVSELELRLLLDAVHAASGFDFREYAPALLRRRVAERVRAENLQTISGLQERLLHHPGAIDRFIESVAHSTSAPFWDTPFFAGFVHDVLPRLRTFPYVRIWVAGCGAGDDAYAIAILLREAGLEHRARIYATDAVESTLARARSGRLAERSLDEYGERYLAAGGTRAFRDYVSVEGGALAYVPELRESIIFAQHNLAMDGSFNEFHCIVARYVLGHFSRTLAYRAHQVIFESLIRLGVLGVGSRESLRYTPHQRAYEPLAESGAFYRRMR